MVEKNILRRQDSKVELGSDMENNESEHIKMGNILPWHQTVKMSLKTQWVEPDGWSRKSLSFRSEAEKTMCC